MKPVFSIITVHFNQLPLLKSTVENIISLEGFGEIIEYIIVDGMSTDGTIDYLHHLQAGKSIQKLVERDKGIYDAMNKGIKLASGEYVIFINAGDQVVDNALFPRIMQQFPDFDVLYGDTLIGYENFSRTAKAKPLSKIWQALPFVHQSVIVRKKCMEPDVFNLAYKFCADYELILRLHLAGVSFQNFNGTISFITAGGLSDKQRVQATKEVFKISKQLIGLKSHQKLYFRIKVLWAGMTSVAKKIFPRKVTQTITRQKYSR